MQVEVKNHSLKLSKRQNNLPPDIFNLTHLTKLEIIAPGVENLPNLFNKLSNLKQLSLICEKLSNVPSSILSLPNLTYLKIKGGTFTSLCHLKIKSSPKIKDLLIFKTKLKNIPKWSYELEHLEHLNVSDNKIENIKDENINFRASGSVLKFDGFLKLQQKGDPPRPDRSSLFRPVPNPFLKNILSSVPTRNFSSHPVPIISVPSRPVP